MMKVTELGRRVFLVLIVLYYYSLPRFYSMSARVGAVYHTINESSFYDYMPHASTLQKPFVRFDQPTLPSD